MRDAVVKAATSGPVRRFFAGVGLLGRGLGMWITSPKLMLLGAIPALIVGAVYTALLVVLFVNIDAITVWATPFAETWDAMWRTAMRLAAGAAFVGIAILVLVFTFAAITLIIGDHFYERIWREVENHLGDAPQEPESDLWTSLARGTGNGLRLLLLTALVGLALFVLGLIPIIGQTLVPVLALAFGGWFLAVDLTGFTFDSRGMSLRERRRVLGIHRATTLGFGMATYVLFLIPLAAVIVMPAAVAGAALLGRSALERPGFIAALDPRHARPPGGPGPG